MATYKFSLQFDDDEHSLSAEDGISMDKLAELLADLYDAIDLNTHQNCTLTRIRGNCYALDFTTKEETYETRFKIIHTNINEFNYEDLEPKEKKYATTLKKIIGSKYYVKAFDGQKNEIASIKEVNKEKSIDTYYTQKMIYGIVAELGATELSSTNKHIRLDGYSHKIYISKEIDMQLKPYYGSDKLMIKINEKRSAISGRIIRAEMVSFQEVGKKKLNESFKEIGYVDFDLIKKITTLDQLIDKLYASNH